MPAERSLQLGSDMAGAKAAIAAAKSFKDLSERDASDMALFDMLLDAPAGALAHVHCHVARWPGPGGIPVSGVEALVAA